MQFTLDSTLGDLLNHPQAKTVLERNVPGVSTHPLVVMAQGMSLNILLSYPQAAQLGLSKDKVEAILVEINKRV